MLNLNSIPLASLRTIEVIARHGSLRSAADELGVTPGALSQRLAKAEEALGQALFVRKSTGLEPTDLCTKIAPRLTAAITELSSVVSDLQGMGQNTLTVSVAPLFASRWLIWRIKGFNDQNPGISLRIFPTLDVVDLDHSEVDIGIRVGESPTLGAGATKLLDQRVFPVCSPDIAARITSPDDMFALPVIREDDRLYGWAPWLADLGYPDHPLRPGPVYADAALCLDAAMTGQGVFMAWETLACDALARGQIESPFDLRSETGATYWFAVSRRSTGNPNVNAFQSWLRDELECSMRFWNERPASLA